MNRKWTVMIYLAGDNNLREEVLWAIKEMKRVRGVGPGPKEKVTVVALLDTGEGIPPLVYDIKEGDKDGVLLREAIRITEGGVGLVDDIDTGDPQPLIRFICNTIQNPKFQADHYMVILSGHGSGSEGDFLSDFTESHSLTIPNLGAAFQKICEVLKQELDNDRNKGKIDILGMDSCLMSMAEVAYQLRDCVSFLVGTEGFEPNTGWPYQRILQALVDHSNATTEYIAKEIVEKYVSYYFDYALAGLSVDLSALDLNQMKNVKDKVDLLARKLRESLRNHKLGDLEVDNILLAHWEAQTYKSDQFVDLYDFCVCLERRSKIVAVKRACKAVQETIQRDGAEGVVLKSCYSGPAFQYSHGLSVYFPWANVTNSYEELDFVKLPNDAWYQFLKDFVEITRREPRHDRRFDEKSEKSVLNKLFNPVENPPTQAPDEVVSLSSIKTHTQINLKGIVSNTVSMKNPPFRWFPGQCIDISKLGLKPESTEVAIKNIGTKTPITDLQVKNTPTTS